MYQVKQRASHCADEDGSVLSGHLLAVSGVLSVQHAVLSNIHCIHAAIGRICWAQNIFSWVRMVQLYSTLQVVYSDTGQLMTHNWEKQQVGKGWEKVKKKCIDLPKVRNPTSSSRRKERNASHFCATSANSKLCGSSSSQDLNLRDRWLRKRNYCRRRHSPTWYCGRKWKGGER